MRMAQQNPAMKIGLQPALLKNYATRAEEMAWKQSSSYVITSITNLSKANFKRRNIRRNCKRVL